MNPKSVKNKKYYVIFTKSESKSWIFRFLQEGFHHVYIAYKSEGEQFWTIINPLTTRIDVENRLVDEFPHPRLFAGPYAVIVPVEVASKEGDLSIRIGVLSCVEVVKAFLGIRNIFILTPYQLYKNITGGYYGQQD